MWWLLMVWGCALPTQPSPPAADVLAVEVTGKPGDYTFSVTVQSPDTGCDAFADWWEVVRADGTLAYRRVLRHSHTEEQPFRRAGAPVPVQADERLWIRAHFRGAGFGAARTGTATRGFSPAPWPEGLGDDLLTQEPLPDGCLY